MLTKILGCTHQWLPLIIAELNALLLSLFPFDLSLEFKKIIRWVCFEISNFVTYMNYHPVAERLRCVPCNRKVPS